MEFITSYAQKFINKHGLDDGFDIDRIRIAINYGEVLNKPWEHLFIRFKKKELEIKSLRNKCNH